MEFALYNGRRETARPGGKAICPQCGSQMIAKCGPRVMHHWAHYGRRNCDPWWENETSWHREWKGRFPEDCREVSHLAPDGEIHRADIKTRNGIVIEVQHSSMTDAERLSREAFYQNLVWIVDGRPFQRNFDVLEQLPDPASELGADLVWYRSIRRRRVSGSAVPRDFGICWSLSKNRLLEPTLSKNNIVSTMVEICGSADMLKIESQLQALYCGHHQYVWMRPRQTWLDATCPVFIDFEGESLFKLEVYDETGLPCVRRVSKERFLFEAMTFDHARDIARPAPPPTPP